MSEITVTVEGFIATDPKQGATQAGKAYLGVSVAHNERKKNQQSGQWENAKDANGNDIVSWVKATFWGDEALALAGQLSKGMLVTLRGAGRVTAYIDQNGVARGQLEINWPKIAIIPRTGGQQAAGGANPAGQQGWAQPGANAAQSGFNDEQPF